MNLKEVRRLVTQLQSNLFKNSNSYSLGMLKSHFRGSGLQFKEHRVYESGDDVRFIDWKMMAKTTLPYLKTFDEERNIEILVVIDASESMLYGYKGVSKLQAAINICSLMYLLADQSGDYIHTLILSHKSHILPKASGERGIVGLVSLLRKLEIMNSEGEIRLQSPSPYSLEISEREAHIQKHLAGGREVVLLSDFNHFLRNDFLKKMVSMKRVHSFRILSPIDSKIKTPYNIFSKKIGPGNKGGIYTLNSSRNEKENIFGKRIKDLHVDERYLENFVKEML